MGLRGFVAVVVSWMALAFSAALLNAQLNRAIMEGIVTDPQGAVIAGADVTITAVDTNVVSTTKSNSTGYYRVVDLVPGKYKARFSAAGFNSTDVVDVEAPAGQTVKVDAQLKLGSTTETVQVVGEVPLLETTASNFSHAVENRSIQEVPLNGRDLQQLVYLLPGVSNAAGPPGSNFGFNSQFGSFPDPTYVQGSDISVNGGQSGANAWYLDGNINLSGISENVAVNPSPDSVSEFQAITSAFAAEYSRTGGGVFNVVLKSGTNSFHGNLYEFVRNSATNARNPFTSIDANGNLIPDRDLHFNNFGGTSGGPVVLPKIYDGKNKTFYFFSLDHQILHLNGHQVFTVPTARMRTGDMSEDPSSLNYGIWDPYSTVGPDSNGLFSRTAFGTPIPGNPFGADGCTNAAVESGKPTCNFATKIPQNRLDPVAMFFMGSYPLPNYNDPLSNCPMGKDGFKICNNFLGGEGSSQNPYNMSLKFDHQASDKSKFFAEWIYAPGQYNNYRLPWTGPSFPAAEIGYGVNLPLWFTNQVAGLGNTYVFSPSFINEFRASFSRQSFSTHPATAGYPDSVTGLSQITKVLAPSRMWLPPYEPEPSFFVGLPAGDGTTQFGTPQWVNGSSMAEAYTYLDNVTKIIGKHTLKTGFVYRLEHSARIINPPLHLGFQGGLTSDPTTGLGAPGMAQFMLGAVDNTSQLSYTSYPYLRDRYWGFYVQDDYRITANFTLNFGVRYDINGYFKTRQGPMSNFCLSCPNPLTGLKGKMIYWGDPEFPNGHDMAPANKDSIGPRLNFAWTPFKDKKTVIRGGFDIFYTNAVNSYNNVGQGIASGPQWQVFLNYSGSFYPNQCAPLTGNCVAFPLSDTTVDKSLLTQPPVPADRLPLAAHRDPSLGAGGIQFYYPASHDPEVLMRSLEIERELPWNMLLDVAYVGSHGTHLAGDTFRNFSYVHTADKLKYRTAIGATVPITDYFSGATAAALQKVYGSDTLPRSLLLQDYPFFGSLFPQTLFNGATNYNGLNVKLQKRYSNGLNFIAAYTFSKKINNAATAQLAAELLDPIHNSRPGLVGGRIGAGGGPQTLGGLYQDYDNENMDRTIAVDDITHMFNMAASYDLPVGQGKRFLNTGGVVNAILGGWRFTGNFAAESGVPLHVSGPCNGLTCFPNLVGNPALSKSRSKVDQEADWINAAAFQPVYGADQSYWANPDPTDNRWWQFASAGAYLPGLRAPGFWNVDSSLVKEFHLTEQRYFQFRWEMFNALNHQNLGLPNTSFCLPPGPNGETDTVHQAGCSFGRITNIQTDPRSMQFALKFYF
ncbi:MAG TPA: TonB-dependent receptor [Bryobacteraceae bacterium]|nr:TonB-dependent receptor [Bryobacteraceae bacterium]